ncbi:22445_t:CDS:2, partial [Racocetra persica]
GEQSEADRMLLYVKDLHKKGNSYVMLGPIEGKNWDQQIDYLCICLQLCRLDRVILLQYYYHRYKKALRIAHQVYALYQIHDVHSLLIFDYISAYAILEMTKENFELLLEEVKRRCDEKIEPPSGST